MIINATLLFSNSNILVSLYLLSQAFLGKFVANKYVIYNEINSGSMRKTHTFVNLVLRLGD